MTSISKAAALLDDVSENTLKPFEEQDPFNPQNVVSGFLCRQSDRRYGALVICSVNWLAVPEQVVFCTPKLRYPFGRTNEDGGRNYHWPPDVTEVRVYDKIDGTNICNWSYEDSLGNRFSTFKTRLTPFLRTSTGGFGDFLGLWNEILERSGEGLRSVPSVLSGERTLSYEMYGYRNPHLIAYPGVALEARLLFGVDQRTGEVVLPNSVPEVRLPSADLLEVFSDEKAFSSQFLTESYNKWRDQIEDGNVAQEDGTILGSEGTVFYVLSGDTYLQYKAKPQGVEAQHWSSGSIPMSIILPTVWNALESCDELTTQYVAELLLEEFPASAVDVSRTRIGKAIDQVHERLAYREKILAVYRENAAGLVEKRDIMRAMSPHFPKSEMKKVFTSMKELGLVQ